MPIEEIALCKKCGREYTNEQYCKECFNLINQESEVATLVAGLFRLINIKGLSWVKNLIKEYKDERFTKN